MTTETRSIVLEATDHLASRLDGVIAEVLEPHLGGLEWTAILVELDRIKGRRSMVIMRNDLQPQLRVLTERLGDLGFPLDDESRTVSTVASDLRTVRRNLAHTNPFTTLEAWRAADQCVRLLEALDDGEGLVRATEVRHEAFLLHAQESGLGPAPAHGEDEPGSHRGRIAEKGAPEPGGRAPDPKRVDRPLEQLIRGERGEDIYVPWPGGLAGGVDVLDKIRRNEAKAQVRSLAEEIVEFEWPIALDRLARAVGRGFGLKRVTKDRAAKITRQIRNSDVSIDAHEFVWPTDVDPAEWNGFRLSNGAAERPFENISPREIANALSAVRRDHTELGDDGHERLVLEMFGRTKRTRGVVSQLDLAWEVL